MQISKVRVNSDIVVFKTANLELRLRCDRAFPCNNCVKRKQSSACRYVGPPGPHSRTSQARAEPGNLQERLEHLENLVYSFVKNQVPESQTPVESAAKTSRTARARDGKSDLSDREHAEEEHTSVDSQGRILVDSIGTRYIDAAHWKAILEDVSLLFFRSFHALYILILLIDSLLISIADP